MDKGLKKFVDTVFPLATEVYPSSILQQFISFLISTFFVRVMGLQRLEELPLLVHSSNRLAINLYLFQN